MKTYVSLHCTVQKATVVEVECKRLFYHRQYSRKKNMKRAHTRDAKSFAAFSLSAEYFRLVTIMPACAGMQEFADKSNIRL